jgi:hypothetical protein
LGVKGAFWIGGIIALAILAGVIITPMCAAFGWFQGAAEIASFDNVREQFREGYENYEGLVASAEKYCVQKGLLDGAIERGADGNTVTQRESQLASVEANFASIAKRFNAWAEDIFRGDVVGPPDLPERAPSLQELAPC